MLILMSLFALSTKSSDNSALFAIDELEKITVICFFIVNTMS